MASKRGPRGWRKRIKSALLNVISLSRVCTTVIEADDELHGRSTGEAALRREVEQLKEKLRGKDARMGRVAVVLGPPDQLWRYAECERVDETNALGVRRVYFVKRWGSPARLRHGPYVEYWPNGARKFSTEYVNGHGPVRGATWWRPDGYIQYEILGYDTAK